VSVKLIKMQTIEEYLSNLLEENEIENKSHFPTRDGSQMMKSQHFLLNLN